MKFLLILSSALLFSVVGNAAGGLRESERDSKYKSYEKSSYEITEKQDLIPNNKSEILARDRGASKLSGHNGHQGKNSKSDYNLK